MRVGIDMRLNSYRVGGIPAYTAQLLMALGRVAAPNELFVAIRHRKPLLDAVVDPPGITTQRVVTPPHHRWEQTLLPLELASLRADVLHFPDFIPLFRRRTPAVITVHDLAFLHYPKILDSAAARFYGQIRRAVEHAAAIIAVSHSTRHDLIRLLDVNPAKIEVIYEAAAPHFQPLELPAQAERIINGHSLHADTFALFVGTIEPRKNLTTLLQALRLVKDQAAGKHPRLVVAGARGWLDDDVVATVADLRLDDAVTFVGPTAPSDLVWLYNACRVYLHPELYSGFGLPVLEAMQCGAPAIVADTSSLPEVAGNAAVLLPPRDAESWAAAWARLWTDAGHRKQLRQQGLQRAAQFSWTTTARATLELYRRLAHTTS
ncbi:MAG: glycosyltransferase family 4 protein [Chloroflexota bacterium]|nr:glycosyltransferase family 4 protein [Chloroflexota bacterium]PLS77497.1 MAG: glycosyltransferase family 1 protein [Chloroflexota bacterium]